MSVSGLLKLNSAPQIDFPERYGRLFVIVSYHEELVKFHQILTGEKNV